MTQGLSSLTKKEEKIKQKRGGGGVGDNKKISLKINILFSARNLKVCLV